VGPTDEPLASRRARVLVVDDEPDNLELLARALRRDFEVLVASNAEDARRLIDAEQERPIDVVVTDQRMPGQTGLELLAWIAERVPRVRRLIVTAHSDAEAMLEAINRIHVDRFVLKPTQPSDLVATIHELVARDRESPASLAEENARARIRQEILEEREQVLSRRAQALELALALAALREAEGGPTAAMVRPRVTPATGTRTGARGFDEVDLLTGVSSWPALRERLLREALGPGPSRRGAALVVADVDDLEALNRSRGQDAGEAAIIDLGDALAAALTGASAAPAQRPSTSVQGRPLLPLGGSSAGGVARLRGGRFVAALFGTAKAEALATAERICRRYAQLTPESVARAPHTASFGVATLPGDAGTLDELLMKAEVALYTAKAGGKNRVVAY
jgi:PleD family two-component response regulator